MKIYTKTGDQGQTSLASGIRISKTSAIVEAIGTADELNSHLGMLISTLPRNHIVQIQLNELQHVLFNLGSELAGSNQYNITKININLLEQQIDSMAEQVAPLTKFILPTGSVPCSQAHICRTICRRLERRVLLINDKKHQTLQIWINRLSDYFFQLARFINDQKETTWEHLNIQQDD